MQDTNRPIAPRDYLVVFSENRARSMILECADRCVWFHGREVILTPTEFQILSTLARNHRRVVPLEELSRQLWGTYTHGCDNALRVNISNIRRKLGESGADNSCIRAVRGRGYRLVI